MAERPSRKLAVILHADVVGSTVLVQRDESVAHERIRDSFRRFSETIEAYGGVTQEIRGDALVAEFARASDAVTAAIAFQIENTDSNARIEDHIQPQLRIGISLGEVIIADNTITGAGVILAQRLEQLAEPGGLVVQGSVSETVPTRLPFEFDSLGEQTLKGFDQPVRAFVVKLKSGEQVPDSESNAVIPEIGADAGHQRTPLELPDKPSIAVLSFTNMSGDPEQEYFSDGITEDIITELSRFPSLFVIARNSSFTYKGESIDVRRIAQELGVRYVLEGSIRRASNRVRINAQLIDAETGNHIWAERYDRDIEDIFDLQEEITRNVVASVAPQIEMAEMERIRRVWSTHSSAYDLALRAESWLFDSLRMGNPDRLEQAIECAQKSLSQDPRNVHALWIQAFAYFLQYLYRWGPAPDEALNQARVVTEHLFEIDVSIPHAYTVRGGIRVLLGEHDAALADYRRAYALNPNLAWNIFWMADAEALMGLSDKAREHAHLGLRLNPREVDIGDGIAYIALAEASFVDGDFSKAKDWANLAIELSPKGPMRCALMIACCGQLGVEATGQALNINEFAPDFIPSILRGKMTIFKMPEHNALFVDGLRKAGGVE